MKCSHHEDSNFMNTKSTFKDDLIINMTKEFVYTLGFIWADGHVSKKSNLVVIKIIKQDAIKIEPTLFQIGNWNKNEQQRLHWKKVISFSISNRKLSIFLKENDYLIKSGANPMKIISKIPTPTKEKNIYVIQMSINGKSREICRTKDKKFAFLKRLEVIKNTKNHYINNLINLLQINYSDLELYYNTI